MTPRSSFLGFCVSSTLVAALASGRPAAGQGAPSSPSGSGRAEVVLTYAFEGFVLAPDGSAAEGTVVVSSAGGQCVTDASGAFRLEIHVPLEAEEVQITAVGNAGANLVASQPVVLPAAPGRVWVGPLAFARGSSCTPSWLPTFGAQPGTDAGIRALAVYDDGGGPALYAGGDFTSAGAVSANRIARWDGSSWQPLGSGLNDTVMALAVYDDGNGPALYVGGSFRTAGGVNADRIAKWDGSSWTPLVNQISSGAVHALAVYDDGGGPALYVGGTYTTTGGASGTIAKWNGSGWMPVGGGLGSGSVTEVVLALTVYDDGGGAALHAAGSFMTAGGVPASRIARWDGSSWAPLGSGLGGSSLDDSVHALAVYDDGGGPALYAAGGFRTAGGAPANRIARWDGSGWTALGSGLSSTVFALAVYDDGNGAALHAGGEFLTADGNPAQRIAKWDGSSWTPLDSGTSHSVWALAVYDDGVETALHVGGDFVTAGSAEARHAARWNGSTWKALEVGPGAGLDADVRALAVWDDGGGLALYAGGRFRTAGGETATRIARWDGASWVPLGSGLGGVSDLDDVFELRVHDDGSGPALYAGGNFTSAGGVAANQIARWDGSSWTPLGAGVNDPVWALATYDDGGGADLYAGGTFTTAGGVPARGIARWDGSSWTSVGGNNTGTFALAVHDDGGGSALYAGGSFTSVGGVPANRIARWNGSGWTPLGSGLNGVVWALTVHDDGGGPALYAAGDFTIAGGVAANRIARWDGSSWAPLGSGLDDEVRALAVHDDGGGAALYAAGDFTTAGGMAANRIAKWDGSSWTPLGSGTSGPVWALATCGDGSGAALLAGGEFVGAFDSDDSFLARWSCDRTPPVLLCPDSVLVIDRVGDGPGEIVHFVVSASDAQDPSPAVLCTPPSGSSFPPGMTLVTCTATDASGNESTCQFTVTVERKTRRR